MAKKDILTKGDNKDMVKKMPVKQMPKKSKKGC